ncbi:hypothetical protein CCP2SC5_130050 [Azospirillaceae bacterium]
MVLPLSLPSSHLSPPRLWSTLAFRFAITASALSIVFILAIGGGAYISVRQLLIHNIHNSVHNVASLEAERINGLLRAIAAAHESLALNPVISGALADPRGRETYLTPFLRGYNNIADIPISIVVADAQGITIASNAQAPTLPLPTFWIERVITRGGAMAGLIDEGAYPNHPPSLNSGKTPNVRTTADGVLESRIGRILVGVPIRTFGTPNGALLFEFPLDALLTTGRGPLITEETGTKDFPGMDAALRLTIQDNSGRQQTLPLQADSFPHSLTGGAVLTMPKTMESLRAALEVTADHRLLDTPLKKLTLIGVIVGGASAAVVIALAVFAASLLTRQLSDLEKAASRVAAPGASLDYLPTYGQHEIARVGLAFNQMLARLAEAHEELARQSAHQLQQSERRFQSVAETASDAIVIADSSGLITFWNRAAGRIFGYPPEAVIGRSVNILIPERYRAIHEQAMDRLRNGKPPRLFGQTVEISGIRVDGSETPLEISLSEWTIGDRLFFAAIMRDISRRRADELALRESERRLREAERIARAGYWEYFADAQHTIWSPILSDISGHDLNICPTFAAYVKTVVHPEDRAMVLAAHQNPQTRNQLEYRIIRANGSQRFVSSEFTAAVDEVGRPHHWFGVEQDITERKLAEERLRASEARFRAIFEHAAIGIVVYDYRGRILQANSAAQSMFGYSAEELSYMRWQDITHPEDIAPSQERHDALHKNIVDHFMYEKRYLRRDGSLLWSAVTVSAVHMPNTPSPMFTISMVEDITLRREARQRLRESEERFRLALSGTQDGVWDYDLSTGAFYFSPRLKEILGYRDDEMEGSFEEWKRRVHPDDLPDVMADYEAHLSGATPGYDNIHRLRHRDGFYRWILDRGRLARDAEGRPTRMVGAKTDITEMRRNQARLQHLKNRLELILQSVGEGIYGIDATGAIIFANPATATLIGAPLEQLIGRNPHDCFHRFKADGFPYNRGENVTALLANNEKQRQIINDEYFYRNDGSSFPVEYTVSSMETQGEISGAVVVFRDITERRQAEVARRQAEREILDQRDALMRLNQQKDKFFSIIAHDLRTPFNAVLGFSDMLIHDIGLLSQEKIVDYCQTIHDAARQVHKLLENLLEWARLQMNQVTPEPEKIAVHSIIHHNILLFQPMANGKNIQLNIDCAPDLHIFADRRMTDTILRNLINNSLKFTGDGGSVTTSARAILSPVSEDASTPDGTKRKEQAWIEISVIDTGVGMSQEKLNKLFSLEKKISSTGTRGETGTGLGLLLCKELIEMQHGILHVSSTPDVGSTFCFSLPTALL